ncbi:MAG: hypothetical protein KBS96_01900 [Lachnospiraceae bacterium]|nr:hypothetical protein [Candidatus Colinaster scatohippi]
MSGVLFANQFLSYLLVYCVFAVCIIGAVFAGIAVRKNKNKKEAIETTEKATE